MPHHNTIFSQILKFVPRHEFSRLSIKQDGARRSDAMNRWTQFVAIASAQLSGRSVVFIILCQNLKYDNLRRQTWKQNLI